MPSVNFGEKASFEKGGRFIQVKEKGEKIRFRLVRSPNYDGKHFLKNEKDKWDVSYCPKIMSGNAEHCDICEKFFKIIRTIKPLKESITKKNKADIEGKIKVIKDEANPFKVKVTFYYPVIDRGDGRPKLLKTTVGVRNKIDAEKSLRDITKFDYELICTKNTGADYYKLDRVDSAETKVLTEVELKGIEEIKTWDVDKMIESKQSSQEIEPPKEQEVETELVIKDEEKEKLNENVSPSDIPF